MADKDFRIDLILGAKFAEGFRALDEAKRKLEGVDKAAGKFARGTGNAIGTALSVTAAAGVVAASAAAAVMGLYIARTIEAEKVQAQLASRIKDTAGIAGRSLEQLNQTATKLQNLTVFDDEAIGGVQAMLLTFKEIRGLQFDRATASVLDLSTAMGTDLNSAALQLGKALNDPIGGIGALSRAGVQFTDKQKAVIKSLVETGQAAKAQELILTELESQMGSAAEAARNTLGGAVQALKNSFDNLLEGDSGDSGIVGTRNAIENLIKLFDDPSTREGVQSFIAGLVDIAGAAIQAAAKVGDLYAAAKEYYGKDADKSLISLKNERDQIEYTDLPKAQKKRKSAPLGARLLGIEDAGVTDLENRLKVIDQQIRSRYRQQQDQLATKGVDAAFDAITPSSKDSRTGTGTAPRKAKKAGSKSDPDADIKNRTDGLRKEAALLGLVADGEEKASEAAKARYDITEGEFKNKSPQLKAEYLAAAEALDAKNKDTEAEKKRLEAIKDSQAAYRELMNDLRTPAQVAVDAAIAKLNTLTEAMGRKDANPADIDAAKKKVLDQIFTDAPDFGGGQYDPASVLADHAKQLEDWYSGQLTALAQYRESKTYINAEYDQREKTMQAQHAAGLQQLQFEQSQMMLGAASSLFGSLAQIAQSGAGEQSKAYRAMFALSQGFAVAQALIAVYQNAAEASKKAGGWPNNIPIIVGAIAQGLAIVAQIRSVSASGFAEGGYTGSGGKYEPAGVVHKGEGVLTQDDIAKLGGPTGFYALQNEIQQGRARAILRGYSEGGLVGAAGPTLTPPDYSSYPQGAAGMTSGAGGKLSVFNYFDMDAMAQRLARHPAMEKAVVAIASENGQAIQATW